MGHLSQEQIKLRLYLFFARFYERKELDNLAKGKDFFRRIKKMGTFGKTLTVFSGILFLLAIILKEPLLAVYALCIFFMAINKDRSERTRKKYGVFYFDNGQAIPMLALLNTREANRERYIGKHVTVKFPFYRIDTQGDLDTGFDVYFRIDTWKKNNAYDAAILQTLKEDDAIAATGIISEICPGMIFIELEKLERLEAGALIA